MFNLLDIVIIHKLKNNFTDINSLVGIYLGQFENRCVVVVNNYQEIFLLSDKNLKKSIGCNVNKNNWNDELRIRNVKNYYTLPEDKIIFFNGINVIIKSKALYNCQVVMNCDNCWDNNKLYEII